jgi:multiple sugar transport system ATP-binding protein
MTAITANHLTKQFGEKAAVNDISFQVGEGEFLVLVGPSGCGKTTTLRLLAGLESVTNGEIYFGERPVTEIRPKDRNIGMVFQDYAVFPHLTVFENIAYGLRSRGGMSNKLIQQKVEEAAKTFRIDPLLKRKPRQLSGGERQRVALSRAMVRDADVYLYDEPLSNLDAQLRHQAREDILALHKQKGRPSIYVTHDQSEAMSMGDRIAVMRNGKIEQIGTGTELYERPLNLFVAFFIGTPSMNLFDATLRPEGEQVRAESRGFSILLPSALTRKIGSYVGKTVKLGFRPEDLHVPKRAPFEVTEDNTIRGVVNVIEPSSAGSSVYMTTLEEKGEDFIATFNLRLPASYMGKEIELGMNTSRIHLFDAETEQSLTLMQG